MGHIGIYMIEIASTLSQQTRRVTTSHTFISERVCLPADVTLAALQHYLAGQSG